MTNPMKPSGADDDADKTVTFDSEETAQLAAQAADDHGVDLGSIEGSGENGVVTADDVKVAIDTALEQNSKINFASDDAAEYAHTVKDIIDVTKVVGTGKKDGGITKGDLKKAVEAAEKEAAEKAEKEKPPAPVKKEAQDETEAPAEDEEPTVESVLDMLISFGIPVRGALHTKPKVQDTWNKLIKDAVKVRKQL